MGEFVNKDRKYPDTLKVCMSIIGFYMAQWDLHWQWLLDGFTVTHPPYSVLAQGYPQVGILDVRGISLLYDSLFFFFGYITG